MMVELDDLEEIKLFALDHLMAEKKKLEKTYNKKVRLKSFKVNELVSKVPLPVGHKDQFLEKWSSN